MREFYLTFSKVESKIFIVVLVNRGALWKKNVVRIVNICIELSAASRNKYIAKCLACEYWEPIELQIEERKSIVGKHIEKIAEYLSDVSVILSDDCGRVNLPVYNGEDTFK